jgi:hypothetical protein
VVLALLLAAYVAADQTLLDVPALEAKPLAAADGSLTLVPPPGWSATSEFDQLKPLIALVPPVTARFAKPLLLLDADPDGYFRRKKVTPKDLAVAGVNDAKRRGSSVGGVAPFVQAASASQAWEYSMGAREDDDFHVLFEFGGRYLRLTCQNAHRSACVESVRTLKTLYKRRGS